MDPVHAARFRAAAAAFLTAVAGAGLQAQSPARAPQKQAPAPALAVARVPAGARIRLDGHLDEPAWAAADSLDDFRQKEPREGEPASERTVVRVVRDEEALYVGIRCWDREGAHILASQLRRDAQLNTDDYVSILIDSFHDRRTAFLFETNPNGAMRDTEIFGFESTNVDWNGIWDVAVAKDSAGWTAEFRIPFRTLRFHASPDGRFGFNVRRFMRRTNEQVLWRGWRRTEGVTQLAAAGELVGLGPLTRAHGVELRPYVLGRVVSSEHDLAGADVAKGFTGGKVGIDAKAALTPTLTADLTANTDFAQVEVDRQVINLTRFPTFFPEKREFFLEGSGTFDFGTSERAQLFYSRRIGLRDGEAVPILGGVRVTGRQGPWRLGLIDARTGGVDAANDAVVRVTHDLLSRSWVGAMLVDRSGPGVDGSERAGGVDGSFPMVFRGHNVVPAFWLAGTRTPQTPGTPVAWRLSTDYPNDLFDNFVSVYRIESGFSPTLGFVRRTGIWETTGHVDWMPRPKLPHIRLFDITPIPDWDIIADESGSLADRSTWQTADFEWNFEAQTQRGDMLQASVERSMDAPLEAFEVFRGVDVPAGRYWWTQKQVQVEGSPRRALTGEVSFKWGGFYGGHGTEAAVEATWHRGGHLIAGADLTRTQATLPGGSFVAIETAGRLEYALNTRADVLAFVQYNNEDRRADFNVRVHWIPVIGDDVFVVWNSGYTTEPGARFRFPSRRALSYPLNGALVVKAVHRIAR